MRPIAAWTLALLAALVLLAPTPATAASGADLAARAAAALHAAGPPVSVLRDTRDGGFRRIRLAVRDQRHPLVVDLVGGPADATRTAYLLPGGAQTVASSFLTPPGRGLADALAARGRLVIGVTPREASVGLASIGLRTMAGWGLAQHRRDIRWIVTRTRPATGIPHEVIGHSYGALSALDYAAAFDDLARVVALDIFSPDVRADPRVARDAQRTHDALARLIRAGIHVDPTYAVMPALMAWAAVAPHADSGWPRRARGAGGTFTVEGLLHDGLIDSAPAPGLHTPLTGLPGDWLLRGGALAGTYEVAARPRGDRYAFTHTSLATARAATRQAGLGFIPTALERDAWAVAGGLPTSQIDWKAITAPVLWINAERGYGDGFHGADLVRAAGNADVRTEVVPGYAHADLLWSATAERDVWARLWDEPQTPPTAPSAGA